MNIAQKIILFIGLVVFVFAGSLANDRWPSPGNFGNNHVAEINVILQLLITWAMVGVATAGLIYIFKSKRK